jgi:hypothetical protein
MCSKTVKEIESLMKNPYEKCGKCRWSVRYVPKASSKTVYEEKQPTNATLLPGHRFAEAKALGTVGIMLEEYTNTGNRMVPWKIKKLICSEIHDRQQQARDRTITRACCETHLARETAPVGKAFPHQGHQSADGNSEQFANERADPGKMERKGLT